MLPVCVNCWRVGGGAPQAPVELAGNGALAAAADLALALALGDAAAGGGPGRLMMDLAEHHDGVQGSVQLPVPATVAAMADHLTRRGRHRGRPSQHGEGGLGAESARMGPADQQLGGVDGADPGLGEQGRGHDHDELA
jgi:hypothetical protein